MAKKGQTWISAILYLALGLVVIGIILGVTLPVVNNVRDRNTYIQTKELMVGLDKNILEITNEGPGSRRFLSPLTIEKGTLYISPPKQATDPDKIVWKFKTKSKLMEPDLEFKEGNLKLMLAKTIVADEYELSITMEYSNANIKLVSNLANPFVGTYSMAIENAGYESGQDKPTVNIDMKTG